MYFSRHKFNDDDYIKTMTPSIQYSPLLPLIIFPSLTYVNPTALKYYKYFGKKTTEIKIKG